MGNEYEAEYSQGIMGGVGPVVLKNGQPLTVDEIVSELNELQAVRAQGEGDAAATVSFDNSIAVLKPPFELEPGTKLYTRPSAGVVPDGITVEMLDAIWQAGIGAENCDDKDYCQPLIEARIAVEESAAPTTQPTGGEWVRCEDRLPTEADGDANGEVWWLTPNEKGDMTVISMQWSFGSPSDRGITLLDEATHWMPTGLTRPQPPHKIGKGVCDVRVLDRVNYRSLFRYGPLRAVDDSGTG